MKYTIYGPYYQKLVDGKATHIKQDEYQNFYDMQQANYKHKKAKQALKKLPPEKCFPPGIKEILQALGYSVRGNKVSICLKRFVTIECVLKRYHYLPLTEQQHLGSPERLLEISQVAWKHHKQLNARKQKNTFAGCMKSVLSQCSIILR